ncbi:MAG: diguanylate cyclase [Campylobacterales bacterium]|nr:diguanylate cyclase [Campylobacterales bacterium]
MQRNISSYPLLKSLSHELEKAKKQIIFKWLQEPKIKIIFEHHKISLAKFSQNYAPGIITHFIKVIREEVYMGDCPIMSKFLNYMLSKGIAPHEIYTICTVLRTEMTHHFFILKDFRHKEFLQILDEFSIIFDTNLTGVLTLFNDFLNRQNSTIKKSLEYKKKFESLWSLINALDVKVFVVESGNVIMANNLLLESLGLEDLEELHEKFVDGLSFLKELNFERELFSLQQYDKWMEKALTSDTVIYATLFHPLSRKEIKYRVSVKAFSQTTPIKYVLTLQESFFEAFEDEKIIPELDKLTGLTSYVHYKTDTQNVHKELREKAKVLLVVDMRGLRQLNEIAGYEKGDRLIINVANTVQRMLLPHSTAIRLSGSRIGVLLCAKTFQEIYDWSVALRCELQKLSDENYIAFTELKKEQSSNETELHAYQLLSAHKYKEKNHVITDVEDIELYDLLENQEMFTQRFSKLLGTLECALLYNEIIVKHNSKVVKTGEKSIYILVNKKQLYIANIDDSVYLYAKSLGHIRANIRSINMEKSIIEVNRFVFDEHTPLKRKMLRVTPDESLNVQLIDGDISIDVETLYLNEEYISFELTRKHALKTGKMVYLEMSVDDEYIELEGNIHMLKKSDEEFVCVVHMHHTIESSHIIQRYIANRQLQIIQELNKVAL